MVHLARPMFTIADDLLDRNKFLLNVDNGTIDLRTGELGPHDPTDFITKIVPISYDPEAKCPTFLRVVNWITKGDREFVNYLRRAFGYSLTGDTTEQVFFFIIGPGRTGKSVLANVLRELLGEFGLQASMDSFLAKQYDNGVPTDIARLRGARVVVAAEANFDRQIDEAKLKTMTGGDPLVARFMRQDFFQFLPEFKLVLIANDFPRVRASSDAFWRRVRVIPVDRKVPPSQVDPDLGPPTPECQGIRRGACPRLPVLATERPSNAGRDTRGNRPLEKIRRRHQALCAGLLRVGPASAGVGVRNLSPV
jgi:putative DNA primase/helicase